MKFRFMEKRSDRVLSIDKVLESVLDDFELKEFFLIKKIADIWQDVVGNVIATHSRPNRIYKKVLYVSVDHPIYSNEIVMIKDRIKKIIDGKLGFESFRSIRAEVKSINWNRK